VSQIRIGFAGAGFIANVHAAILARDARVRVQAVCDPDAHAAAVFGLKHGAGVAPSFDDLLAAVDALYICTPNALHADMAERGLEAGIHVFCEKPMATAEVDAARVLAASKRARGVYQAGFNRRFAGVYVALKGRIESGALTPLAAMLKMNRGELQQPAWTADPAISGGFLYETPVHMLDLVRFLFGEPKEIVCRARAGVYGQPDEFAMLLTFATGMCATLTACAHATWLFPFERVEVYGTHAIAATEEMERVTFSSGPRARAETADFSQLPFEERWGYVEEDARFVDAMLGTAAPAVDADEAFASTCLVERCYEAAGLAGLALNNRSERAGGSRNRIDFMTNC
jgi:myo-inositol 2-dehydrogenase/D-chiro-inositol 1-dehydrogenase